MTQLYDSLRAASSDSARAHTLGQRMPPLLDKRLIVVTGKGGVGRSTVAAALAIESARRGRRTLLCETATDDRIADVFGLERLGPVEERLGENLHGVAIDARAALAEWLERHASPAPLGAALARSHTLRQLLGATPGARELISIAKVWELAQPQRQRAGDPVHDLTILDAPATGHALAMLRAPRTFAEIARVGTVRRQGDKVWSFLTDPASTGYLAVAAPEVMAVNETLELESSLADQLGAALDAIVVNGVLPRRFSAADARHLEATRAREADASMRAALELAAAEHTRARRQQTQIRRLRRHARACVVTVPFLFEPAHDLAAITRLGRRLARRLERPRGSRPRP